MRNAEIRGDVVTVESGGAGGYIVQAGDTLAGVAANLWGDANLWYKLAEANGLGASSALTEGQRLVVPAGVMGIHHNADTVSPKWMWLWSQTRSVRRDIALSLLTGASPQTIC